MVAVWRGQTFKETTFGLEISQKDSEIIHDTAFFNIYFYLFTWLGEVLVVACGIWFPDQGSNPGSLHWECGVPATGAPGKSQDKVSYGLDRHRQW